MAEQGTRDILIWGAGAIGATVAAYLARAGHRVTCVDTNAAHREAVAANGLHITGPVDEFSVRVAIAAPEELRGTWPFAIVAVKAHYSHDAARALLPHLAADASVITLQNGLAHVEIAKIVHPHPVYAGMVGFAADVLAPGEIRFGKRSDLVIGRPGHAVDNRLNDLVAVMRAFEPNARATGDIEAALWGKLVFVAVLYGTALARSPIAALFRERRWFPVWYGLAHELLSVATAEGIAPESFDHFDLVAFRAPRPAEAAWQCLAETADGIGPNAKPHSGMWRDLSIHKRRTEIDAQLVPIVQLGRRHNLPTPLIEQVCIMIHEVEAGTRLQSDDALLDLLALTGQPDAATRSAPSIVSN